MIPIPFAKHAYQNRSLPVSAQRCLNLYPEAQPPDSRAPVVLHGTPGLGLFSTIGADPVLGMHTLNGAAYAMTRIGLYSISAPGVATLIGPAPITGRVSSADSGSVMVWVDGARGYYSDGVTVTQITDSDFYAADTVAYLDGFFLFNRKGTNRFFSNNGTDPGVFDALQFDAADGTPGNVLAVVTNHRQLFVMKSEGIEGYYNTGASPFAFERIQGSEYEKGILAPLTAVNLDNTVYWLGHDQVVYRIGADNAERVSTHAIEYAMKGYASPETARAYAYTDEGHSFYVLLFDEATWVFDAATGLWHERQSMGHARHLADCHCYAYGKHLVGDYSTGKIYHLDMSTYSDNGEEIQRIAVSPAITNNESRLRMSRLQVFMESGVGLTTGQGSDPQAMLDWSDDGGRTWSNEHWAGMGKIGQYRRRVQWRRLGQFRHRVFRLTISDPVKVSIVEAYGDVA